MYPQIQQKLVTNPLKYVVHTLVTNGTDCSLLGPLRQPPFSRTLHPPLYLLH